MKSVWKFFESVKLAIVLFIILALASIVGTLIPQGRSAAEYAAHYGGLSGLFIKLQLTDLYHSAWFLALLFMFALNTIVCTLARLGPKLRRALKPSLDVEEKGIQAMKVKGRFRMPRPVPEAAVELRKALASRHYRLKTSGAGPRLDRRRPEAPPGLVRVRYGPPRPSDHPGGRRRQRIHQPAGGPGSPRGPDRRRPSGLVPGEARPVRYGILSAGRGQGLEEHRHRHRGRHGRPDPGRRGQSSADLQGILLLSDQLRLGLGQSAPRDPGQEAGGPVLSQAPVSEGRRARWRSRTRISPISPSAGSSPISSSGKGTRSKPVPMSPTIPPPSSRSGRARNGSIRAGSSPSIPDFGRGPQGRGRPLSRSFSRNSRPPSTPSSRRPRTRA